MGYPSVETIADCSIHNYKQSTGISYIENLFITSQKIRSENFSTFFNQGLWHSKALEIEPYSSYFTRTFIPPAIQFKNIIKFHKNKDILSQLFIGYCFRSYLRELLTGCSKKGKANLVPVETPYRMQPDELTYWQTIIQQYLNNILGFNTNITLY